MDYAKYKKAKGSAGVSGAKTMKPKTRHGAGKSAGLVGWADSRPQNSDRKQSAR